MNDLDCLVGWPVGSAGEAREREVVRQLLSLCEENGFGRVSQLAQQIEDVWRKPAKIAEYREEQQRHRAYMTSHASQIEDYINEL